MGARKAAVSLLVCAALVCAWAQTSPAQAPSQTPKTSPQTEEVLPSYEGQNVSSVELAGHPGLNTANLEPLLAQKQGEPFSTSKIEETVVALKKTGQFENVRLEVRPETSGVRVLFVLEPAVYYGIYEFPGSGHFAYSRLLQVANYPPRGAYTEVDVKDAQVALEKFFERSGYFLAEVRPSLELHKNYGLVDIIYNVTLGKRANFGNVDIQGTTPEEAAQLAGALRSFWARLRGAAIRPGKKYKLKTVENATQYLENSLMKQDHLAAQVELLGANYDPETNRADVSFHVNPGPIVHVKIEGAHLWSWTKKKLLPIYQENGLDPELVQEGRQNLVSYFQSKGYFNAKVGSKLQKQSSNEETVFYQITKGPRHKVTAVDVAGNKHISSKQLLSHVAVKKARPLFFFFSHGKYSEKLVRTSVKNLSDVYKADGFSSVRVTPEVKNENGNIAVTFRINEGPQDIVDALKIEGNKTLSEAQFAPKGLKLQPGRPYSQKLADEDRNQIMARYLQLGYLTASFRETAQQSGSNKHHIIVVYHITEGPQVHTEQKITLGRRHAKQELINRETASIQPGKPLRETDMLSSESKLYTPGVFDWAEIDPRRPITTQTKEDVVVKVHEAKRNLITWGVGFEVVNRGGSVPSGTVAVPGLPPVGLPSTFITSEKTFWGPRGSFEYTRKDLRGKGESLTLGALAGRLDQRGSAAYLNPNFRWTNWSSNLSVSGEHNSENPIFTFRQFQFDWQLQRALNPDKTQNFFVRYSYQQTGLTQLLIPELVPPEDQHVRLSSVSTSYVRDTRDNPLDAHKGIYETFTFDLNPTALGSNVDFARILGQTAYYKKIPADIIWANSIRIGLEKSFAGSHVPLSEKFFSGGGSTLRGFPLDGAGPQRTIPACGNPSDPKTCSLITVPVGGDQLFILNSEFRYPLSFIKKNLGFVTFYDGGNVFSKIGFHGQYTNTVGIGFRYATPVGPIRIDIGHNLNAPPGIKSTQVFVTLGQAF
jgi:outer membrane protein insertion porin family